MAKMMQADFMLPENGGSVSAHAVPNNHMDAEPELENCALCGRPAGMQRDHCGQFDGQTGTARYICCDGEYGPVGHDTKEGATNEAWNAWTRCEPDDCETFDEEYGGEWQAGVFPRILKWNAMQRSIREAMALSAATPAASVLAVAKGVRL